MIGLACLFREICVHYRAFLQCIRANFLNFNPTDLSIPKEVFIKSNAASSTMHSECDIDLLIFVKLNN